MTAKQNNLLIMCVICAGLVATPTNAQTPSQDINKMQLISKPNPENYIGKWIRFKDDKYEIGIYLEQNGKNAAEFNQIKVYFVIANESRRNGMITKFVYESNGENYFMGTDENRNAIKISIRKNDSNASIACEQAVEYVQTALSSSKNKTTISVSSV